MMMFLQGVGAPRLIHGLYPKSASVKPEYVRPQSGISVDGQPESSVDAQPGGQC